MRVRDAPVRDVLMILASRAGMGIVVSGMVRGRTSVELYELSPLDALRLVARINGYDAQTVRGIVCVGSREDVERLRSDPRYACHVIRYGDSTRMASLLSKVFDRIDVVEDRRTNTIVIVPRTPGAR